jgi:hypothetical protein
VAVHHFILSQSASTDPPDASHPAWFVLSPALGAASAVGPTDVARLASVSVGFCRVQQTLSMLT